LRYGCTDGELTYKTRAGEKVIQCWKKADDEELAGWITYYDDVKDLDKVAVEDNKLNKIDDALDTAHGSAEEGEHGDTKF
jgi:hypothetical protein